MKSFEGTLSKLTFSLISEKVANVGSGRVIAVSNNFSPSERVTSL